MRMKAKHRLILVTAVLTSLVWTVVLLGLAAVRSPQPAGVKFLEDDRFEFDGILLHDRVAPWRLPDQPDPGTDFSVP
jgi:hypothetical protein